MRSEWLKQMAREAAERELAAKIARDKLPMEFPFMKDPSLFSKGIPISHHEVGYSFKDAGYNQYKMPYLKRPGFSNKENDWLNWAVFRQAKRDKKRNIAISKMPKDLQYDLGLDFPETKQSVYTPFVNPKSSVSGRIVSEKFKIINGKVIPTSPARNNPLIPINVLDLESVGTGGKIHSISISRMPHLNAPRNSWTVENYLLNPGDERGLLKPGERAEWENWVNTEGGGVFPSHYDKATGRFDVSKTISKAQMRQTLEGMGRGSIWGGHNVKAFDFKKINRELSVDFDPRFIIDTMKTGQAINPEHRRNFAFNTSTGGTSEVAGGGGYSLLEQLKAHAIIPEGQAHQAGSDAINASLLLQAQARNPYFNAYTGFNGMNPIDLHKDADLRHEQYWAAQEADFIKRRDWAKRIMEERVTVPYYSGNFIPDVLPHPDTIMPYKGIMDLYSPEKTGGKKYAGSGQTIFTTGPMPGFVINTFDDHEGNPLFSRLIVDTGYMKGHGRSKVSKLIDKMNMAQEHDEWLRLQGFKNGGYGSIFDMYSGREQPTKTDAPLNVFHDRGRLYQESAEVQSQGRPTDYRYERTVTELDWYGQVHRARQPLHARIDPRRYSKRFLTDMGFDQSAIDVLHGGVKNARYAELNKELSIAAGEWEMWGKLPAGSGGQGALPGDSFDRRFAQFTHGAVPEGSRFMSFTRSGLKMYADPAMLAAQEKYVFGKEFYIKKAGLAEYIDPLSIKHIRFSPLESDLARMKQISEHPLAYVRGRKQELIAEKRRLSKLDTPEKVREYLRNYGAGSDDVSSGFRDRAGIAEDDSWIRDYLEGIGGEETLEAKYQHSTGIRRMQAASRMKKAMLFGDRSTRARAYIAAAKDVSLGRLNFADALNIGGSRTIQVILDEIKEIRKEIPDSALRVLRDIGVDYKLRQYTQMEKSLTIMGLIKSETAKGRSKTKRHGEKAVKDADRLNRRLADLNDRMDRAGVARLLFDANGRPVIDPVTKKQMRGPKKRINIQDAIDEISQTETFSTKGMSEEEVQDLIVKKLNLGRGERPLEVAGDDGTFHRVVLEDIFDTVVSDSAEKAALHGSIPFKAAQKRAFGVMVSPIDINNRKAGLGLYLESGELLGRVPHKYKKTGAHFGIVTQNKSGLYDVGFARGEDVFYTSKYQGIAKALHRRITQGKIKDLFRSTVIKDPYDSHDMRGDVHIKGRSTRVVDGVEVEQFATNVGILDDPAVKNIFMKLQRGEDLGPGEMTTLNNITKGVSSALDLPVNQQIPGMKPITNKEIAHQEFLKGLFEGGAAAKLDSGEFYKLQKYPARTGVDDVLFRVRNGVMVDIADKTDAMQKMDIIKRVRKSRLDRMAAAQVAKDAEFNVHSAYAKAAEGVAAESAGVAKVAGEAGAAKGSSLLVFGALALGAGLLSLTAFSSRGQVSSPRDVARQPYGAGSEDARMSASQGGNPPAARITSEGPGTGGYSTNVDVYATDYSSGVDYKDLANVMNGHMQATLGVSKGSTSIEINDNSSSNAYDLNRQYANMLRG